MSADAISSTGAAPIWAKAEEDRKDVQVPSLHQELQNGSAWDFAKKHPEILNSSVGCAANW